MKSNLKIAFLTSSDPEDKRSWSGTHFMMFREFKKHFVQVDKIGPINSLIFKGLPLINRITRFFLKKGYNHNQSILRSFILSIIISKKLKTKSYDLIFAPTASTEIALLNTKTPIIYLSDSSFGQLHEYYDVFKDLHPWSVTESNYIEEKALKKSKMIVYPSKWAKDFTKLKYNIEIEKINIIPFGANIDEELLSFNEDRKNIENQTLELLFVGVYWERKGGNIVYNTFLKLIESGIDVHLTICGCLPPILHEKISVYPFLNKNDKKDSEILSGLFNKAHFLFIPTRADCSPIVFSEAFGFGLPVITNKTGGVGEIVENNINGISLDYHADPIEYKDAIIKVINDKELYNNMIVNALKKHNDTLNWNKWGEKMTLLITKIFEI